MLFDTHAHIDDRAFDADREVSVGGAEYMVGLEVDRDTQFLGIHFAEDRDIEEVTVYTADALFQKAPDGTVTVIQPVDAVAAYVDENGTNQTLSGPTGLFVTDPNKMASGETLGETLEISISSELYTSSALYAVGDLRGSPSMEYV